MMTGEWSPGLARISAWDSVRDEAGSSLVALMTVIAFFGRCLPVESPQRCPRVFRTNLWGEVHRRMGSYQAAMCLARISISLLRSPLMLLSMFWWSQVESAQRAAVGKNQAAEKTIDD